MRKIAADVAAYSKFVTGIFLIIGIYIIVAVNKGVFSKEVIGEIAGYVNLIAYIPYFVSIYKGQTKPNKVTWWTWAVLEIMMSASYISAGAGSTRWLPIAAVIGMFFTAILSLKFGDKQWHTSDCICAVGSVLGLVVWVVSGSPVIALVVFLSVDLFAAIPTFIKAWREPISEDLFAWVVTLASGIINLVALESSSFSIVILPLYNFAIYLIVVILLKLGRKFNTP